MTIKVIKLINGDQIEQAENATDVMMARSEAIQREYLASGCQFSDGRNPRKS